MQSFSWEPSAPSDLKDKLDYLVSKEIVNVTVWQLTLEKIEPKKGLFLAERQSN